MRNSVHLILFLFWIPQFTSAQIIADHTVVGKFEDIPQQYIDEVKKIWLVVAGESHSAGYRAGLTLLGQSYPAYAVSVVESGSPELYTIANLRASRATWGDVNNTTGWIYDYGEEDWWTSSTSLSRTKAGITFCNTNNLQIGALGFGWCWDPSGGGPSFGVDPVYGVHWYGWSEGSGHYSWGLDDEDNSLTSNTVNMDTYLRATQEYIDYCTSNGYPTKVFFTTGPVDNWEGDIPDEAMYQQHLKYEHIREYVRANSSRILFDYADILCYDNDGTPTTVTWNGHEYPRITSTNLLPTVPSYHISEQGALRLAKAMWWMLARMAGWDGEPLATSVNDAVIFEKSEVVIESGLDRIMIRSVDQYLNGQAGLYNLKGYLVERKNIIDNLIYINTSSLPLGIYLLVLSKDNIREVKKIIIFR